MDIVTTDGSLQGSIASFTRRTSESGGWRVEDETGPDATWTRVSFEGSSVPPQGWKLHVTAAGIAAESVLTACLPVLLAEKVCFKVARSTEVLEGLNDGVGGLSQIGKFITVYPRNDEEAVRLAVALDEATAGMRGPAVPRDRALTATSLVHYRYGSSGERIIQTRMGPVVPALLKPDGELIEDDARDPVPDWVDDPFVAAGVSEVVAPPAVASRYVITQTLHRSPGSAVHLAVDTKRLSTCVLKQAFRDARLAADGKDARDHLRWEADLLRRLAPDRGFPEVFDVVDERGDTYMAMEFIAGETLIEHTGRFIGCGRLIPEDQGIAWGRELAALLARVHSTGHVYRDLKPSNIIVGSDGRLRLIDFELASPTDSETPRGVGSRGYCSRRQAEGGSPELADDIYALGAVLYMLFTGADPADAPDEFDLTSRSLKLLNPSIDPSVKLVIERCLGSEHPAISSVSEVEAALAAAVGSTGKRRTTRSSQVPPPVERYRAQAKALGDALCIGPRVAGRSLWGDRGVGVGIGSHDLNIGAAGAVLALAELVGEFDDPTHKRELTKGLRLLRDSEPPKGSLSGLYVGQSGMGAALLRGGQALDDEEMIRAAEKRGRWIAEQPFTGPDLFNGTAGRVRFHLLLWDATGASECLEDAVVAGDALVDAEVSGGWTTPPGYEGLQEIAYTGYAHGAAGIADSLLDLWDASGEERFGDTAARTAKWLGSLSLNASSDDGGLVWREFEGGAPFGMTWCRGAAGIGTFLLHASAAGCYPDGRELAHRAALAVGESGRASDPSRCHGLAGSIEFLLDMFQSTGESAYLGDAFDLARALESFKVESEGVVGWLSDDPTKVSPAFISGFSGVAMTLLRLSTYESRPGLLTRAGFRYRPPRLTGLGVGDQLS